MDGKMLGAMLPGDSTVKLKEFEIPKPGHGQVLVKTMASTICGSDIRAIYREHTGKGAEGYIDGMIAGHEPCGQIVEEGPGLVRFKKGDRQRISQPDFMFGPGGPDEPFTPENREGLMRIAGDEGEIDF